MLTLCKGLEEQVSSDKTSGSEKTKRAIVAADIAMDVLKLEVEGIKTFVKSSKWVIIVTIITKNKDFNEYIQQD